ncbi:MAG TPA: 5-amino-6-(D-ribitylamino)uracil--L-tyrosine 4-hydroxyphenyl transferase CofH [Candidatus Limnocylindrales bacterium]|nr:5-amino-6-(D-ribitylamino)uracil--L-tyrosine 4-hydroxyphenyl transferase CofH [Candidatus Limnocylindrales bacterium]
MSYETEEFADRVDHLLFDDRPLERRISSVDGYTAGILARALEGTRPTVEEGAHLLTLRGNELSALVAAADRIRAEDVGDVVTYVVNRNVNWTNICFVGCKFCAFAHLKGDALAYDRPIETVLARIREGVERGATEICMQGGINPEMPADGYFQLLRAIRAEFPSLHIHAYSPMEIYYGARRAGMDYPEFIRELVASGLDTIPGTAAEILDDDVREILSHKKLDVATWVRIITTAHELGVPTTSTVMYGHLETPMHIARHVDLLRSIQQRTGGFTEFVPLRFIWQETRLYSEGLVKPIPQGQLDLAVYATSRLMLRGLIDNLQTSWVKLGHELSTLSLAAGCNDVGGTLMEESISREAGADAGEYTSVEELQAMIRRMGRIPRQRNTVYGLIDEPAAGAEAAPSYAAWS